MVWSALATVSATNCACGLFVAVADATEEAILNSMFRATTVSGHQGAVPALPLDLVLPMLPVHDGHPAPSP